MPTGAAGARGVDSCRCSSRRRRCRRTRDDSVLRVLGLARRYLGIEVAWLSEPARRRAGLHSRRRAAPPGVARIPARSASSRGRTASRVLDGRLPPVVPDTGDRPGRPPALPVTRELGIGAYVGVPVRGADGDVMGMLCCASSVAAARAGARRPDLLRAARRHRRRADAARHAGRRARGGARPDHGCDLGPGSHAWCSSRSSTC